MRVPQVLVRDVAARRTPESMQLARRAVAITVSIPAFTIRVPGADADPRHHREFPLARTVQLSNLHLYHRIPHCLT